MKKLILYLYVKLGHIKGHFSKTITDMTIDVAIIANQGYMSEYGYMVSINILVTLIPLNILKTQKCQGVICIM